MEIYDSPETRRAIQQKLAVRDSNLSIGNDDARQIDTGFDHSEVPKAWDDDDSVDDGTEIVPSSWDDSDGEDTAEEDTAAESGAPVVEAEKTGADDGIDMDYSVVLQTFEYLAETFGDRFYRFNQP